ncbi:MAG: AMIN domain-containing protein [Thermodesulfobacteriota bacterium]
MAEFASAAKLQEIRTGKKSGFTRLVLQFEAPPRFQVKKQAAANQLDLVFFETTSGLLRTNQSHSTPVETVAVQQNGPDLEVVVALSVPGYRLKSFTLTEPHRIVFDLYPVAAEASLVLLNKLVVKASAEEGEAVDEPPPPAAEPKPAPAAPEPAPAEASPPTAMEEKPAATEPEPETIAPEAIEPEQVDPATGTPDKKTKATTAPAQPSEGSTEDKALPESKPLSAAIGTFQRNLIVVLGGISIVILALIGFLLLQKRNNAEKTQPVETGQELKTTADIMASIDARIKEKFKQYEEASPE